jgi:hypothetical protein
MVKGINSVPWPSTSPSLVGLQPGSYLQSLYEYTTSTRLSILFTRHDLRRQKSETVPMGDIASSGHSADVLHGELPIEFALS